MKQTIHWQLQRLQLVSRHLAEQRSLLTTQEAALKALRQEQQKAWTGTLLSGDGTFRLLMRQALEQPTL